MRNLMDNVNTEMQYNAMYCNKQFFSDSIPTASMHICKKYSLMTFYLRTRHFTVSFFSLVCNVCLIAFSLSCVDVLLKEAIVL